MSATPPGHGRFGGMARRRVDSRAGTAAGWSLRSGGESTVLLFWRQSQAVQGLALSFSPVFPAITPCYASGLLFPALVQLIRTVAAFSSPPPTAVAGLKIRFLPDGSACPMKPRRSVHVAISSSSFSGRVRPTPSSALRRYSRPPPVDLKTDGAHGLYRESGRRARSPFRTTGGPHLQYPPPLHHVGHSRANHRGDPGDRGPLRRVVLGVLEHARTSGENRLGLVMAPSSQGSGAYAKPGAVQSCYTWCLGSEHGSGWISFGRPFHQWRS